MAYLTTSPNDKYPHYDPETKTVAGPICVKTEGRGHEFSHVIPSPEVAAALERVIAKRKAEGHDFVFINRTIEDLASKEVNKRLRNTWNKSIDRTILDLMDKKCGVQKVQRVVATKGADVPWLEREQRCHEMGHTSKVSKKYYTNRVKPK
ncbi:hypothetical protein H9P43_006648 [Blastocladiella emersonii ATCC 22665]|nr:hypothetical protein H9P43_006648 [Blastocladiella emersonii ATCC 22665]